MNAAAGLTLDELVDESTRLLTGRGLLEAQADGRVSGAPDARTVRYYGTLGLVDRPAYEGREARYGRRHVLQVIAIKILQSLGLPLAEVQARLYGKSNAELEALLKSAGEAPARRTVPVVVWREVTIEPGLKVMVEQGWMPKGDVAQKVRAALEAMTGGTR
jgi:DNA-binding transcriptional MerR regulator